MKRLGIRCFSLLLALLLCVGLFPGTASANTLDDTHPLFDPVPIDETVFPDEVFRAYVGENIDADGDGSLSQEEIEAVTDITLEPKEYPDCSDLTGIELFTELDFLDCYELSITSLDLRANTKLTSVDCEGNTGLTSLNVSGLTMLEWLDCNNCQISELDLSGMSELYFLDCSSNPISKLDLSDLEGINILYCYNTGVDTVDVSACELLVDVYLNGERTEKQDSIVGVDYVEYKIDKYGGFVILGVDPTATVVTKAAESPCQVLAASAGVKGILELNYYLTIPEEILAEEGSYLSVTFNGKETTYLLKDLTPKTLGSYDCRFLAVPVYARLMRDEMVLRMYHADGSLVPLLDMYRSDVTETGMVYSVYQFIELALESGSDKMKALVAGILDYGTAAQIYFDYNAEGLAVSSAVTDITAEDLSEYASVRTGDRPEGFAGFVTSVLLKEDNTLRVYLYFNDSMKPLSSYTITKDGAAATPVQRSETVYYFEVPAIKPRSLDDQHTFTISDGTTTHTLTTSVLGYAYDLYQNDPSKEAAVTMAKALLRYNLAAEAYFGE